MEYVIVMKRMARGFRGHEVKEMCNETEKERDKDKERRGGY